MSDLLHRLTSSLAERYRLDRELGRGGMAVVFLADLLARDAQERYIPPTRVAGLYAAAGERELAMDWLERGYEERESQMVYLPVSVRWDNLRDHPRFQALLRRMNLRSL